MDLFYHLYSSKHEIILQIKNTYAYSKISSNLGVLSCPKMLLPKDAEIVCLQGINTYKSLSAFTFYYQNRIFEKIEGRILDGSSYNGPNLSVTVIGDEHDDQFLEFLRYVPTNNISFWKGIFKDLLNRVSRGDIISKNTLTFLSYRLAH